MPPRRRKTKCSVDSFLDVVIRKCTTILELLSGEDQALLIGRDAFFVLDLSFHIVKRVARLDVKGYCFAGESFHENLHAAPKEQDQVQCRFFLDVVIRKCTTILELLSGEDQALL